MVAGTAGKFTQAYGHVVFNALYFVDSLPELTLGPDLSSNSPILIFLALVPFNTMVAAHR